MTLTAVSSDPASWDGTYIEFRMIDQSPSGKTQVWSVTAKAGGVFGDLGEVRWFSRWRKYSFFPNSDTLYEQTCLREIAQFIDDRMADRKLGV